MSLFTLIREDFVTVKKNDPALHSNIELFFNYPGLWALFFYRIANSLYRHNVPYLPRLISAIGQFLTVVDIHPAATIGRRVFIDHGVGIVIGETAVIEDDVLIYQQVTLGGVSLEKGKRHPTIKSGTVIGAGAKILGNIIVGNNVKIGANSVVVKNVPDNSTAIGIPARIIAKGFDKSLLSHNKLPDIDKEVFHYLLKRIAVLEHAVKTGDHSSIHKKDHELEEVYNAFLKSMDS
ncbi:MAG: serine O-acetyltransferase [Sulfurovaceae bacterium]|nr:serine O-acetyltransferase [Sulfurovaceae bacterium]